MKTELKRQNFNVTPEQEEEIAWLKEAIDAPTTKDVFLWAVRVLASLARETKQGKTIYVAGPSGQQERVLIPELEAPPRDRWRYLVERPHPWRRQLYLKGRRLTAFAVWMDMLANDMSLEQAAENWDLPLEAVEEVVRYCEANRSLLKMESDEERRGLQARRVRLEP